MEFAERPKDPRASTKPGVTHSSWSQLLWRLVISHFGIRVGFGLGWLKVVVRRLDPPAKPDSG